MTWKSTFLHLELLDEPPVHLIRLNRLSDPSKYFQHVSSFQSQQLSDAKELEAAAKALFDTFIDYKIATVTLLDMSIEAVAPIFERINSKGTALTIVDLMRAATWSESMECLILSKAL